MLAKKYKLPIEKFLAKRPLIAGRSDLIGLKILPNNLEFSRFGVVIIKKVSAKATDRNKVKRIIFDFIRIKKFYLKPGLDILINVFPQKKEIEKIELERELLNTLIKISN